MFSASFGGQRKPPPASSWFYSVHQEELKCSDCTGSSIHMQWQQDDVSDPLQGQAVTLTLTCSMCLTAEQPPLYLNSSNLAFFPVTFMSCYQESELHNQKYADQRMRKSELNKSVSVLLPLVWHEASRQFVTVSMLQVPHVGQPSKGHVQVSWGFMSLRKLWYCLPSAV